MGQFECDHQKLEGIKDRIESVNYRFLFSPSLDFEQVSHDFDFTNFIQEFLCNPRLRWMVYIMITSAS